MFITHSADRQEGKKRQNKWNPAFVDFNSRSFFNFNFYFLQLTRNIKMCSLDLIHWLSMVLMSFNKNLDLIP